MRPHPESSQAHDSEMNRQEIIPDTMSSLRSLLTTCHSLRARSLDAAVHAEVEKGTAPDFRHSTWIVIPSHVSTWLPRRYGSCPPSYTSNT